MFSVITSSPEQTWRTGRLLGELLTAGDAICLYGELGAGKTNFAYGVAQGLKVKDKYITSPTFTFVNEYAGRVPFYHLDLYRINDPEELANIGFAEYLGSKGVTVIEWAERAEEELPGERLSIYLSSLDEERREIGFFAEGERFQKVLEELKQELKVT